MEKSSFQSIPNLVSLAKDKPGPVIAEIIESLEKNIESSLEENMQTDY